MEKVREEKVYVCNFCNKTYGDIGSAELHLGECLLNYMDNSTCVTCKHACLNLEAPYMKDNGYNSLRLLQVTGNKAFLTCEKGVYEGKITQEKILREEKSCYEPIDSLDEGFVVKKTDEYVKYQEKMEQADLEQKELDASITEYHMEVQRLIDEGHSEEEIRELLQEKYKEE